MSKKAKKETEEVAKTESPTGLATQTAAGLPAVGPSLADWGVTPVDVRKIVIARILPQQPMSKFVVAGKAMIGDIMESTNGTKLGDINTPIDFVPFHHVENWIVFEEKNGAMKFSKIEAITPENDSWPIKEVINGVKIERDRALEFYVLLPRDLEQGIRRPYVMSFRRTSTKAGKKLYTTMFVTNPANGKIPAATVLSLSGTKTTNDKGTFLIMDVIEKRASTTPEMQAAFEWFKTVSTSKNVQVDNSDLDASGGVTDAPVAPGGVAQF